MGAGTRLRLLAPPSLQAAREPTTVSAAFPQGRKVISSPTVTQWECQVGGYSQRISRLAKSTEFISHAPISQGAV